MATRNQRKVKASEETRKIVFCLNLLKIRSDFWKINSSSAFISCPILRIISITNVGLNAGSVICLILCNLLAPSIMAASYKLGLMEVIESKEGQGTLVQLLIPMEV